MKEKGDYDPEFHKLIDNELGLFLDDFYFGGLVCSKI